uniref:Uncharacterized protein n=1 Tax=Oryza nivara TaxID=4536 RepID=A0A0E0HRP2_ORYNI
MRLASGCMFTTGWMQHLAASVLRRPPRGSARREEESSPEGQGGQGEQGKMGMLWMPFTPCYADADARSKGRPWVPNPAATTSLLPDLVTRSGRQALAVSTPDGVPQRYKADRQVRCGRSRVVGYVELIGGDSSSSAAMGEDTQEAKALMIAIVPHLHRCDLVFILQSCILRNLESNLPKANKISHETLMGCAKYTTMQPQVWITLVIKAATRICSLRTQPARSAPASVHCCPARYSRLRWPLLAGRLRRVGCLPVLVDKCALRRLRFKASRLLAEWSSLFQQSLSFMYLVISSSNIQKL